jgi:glucan phosphoethanolaminetransferase (alkaline phosphatase superfamily)
VRLFRKILGCRHSWGFTIYESFDSLLISFHQRNERKKNEEENNLFDLILKKGESYFFLSNRKNGTEKKK